MALLEIRIPNNKIIRVAQAHGYGFEGNVAAPLTQDGAEQFLLRKIKAFLMSRLKMVETSEPVRLARKQAEDVLDAEDVVRIVRGVG